VFLAISLIALSFGIYKSGIKFAYKVNYNGVNIATVSSKDVFDDAVSLTLSKVESKKKEVEKVISTPKYSLTIALNSMLSDKKALSNRIIDNSDEIIEAYKACANGKKYVYCCSEKTDIVEEYLAKFDIDGAECKSEFLCDVQVEKGYFLSKDVDAYGNLQKFLSTIPVKTVANLVSDISIDFETITVSTSELVIGTNKVKTEGLCGTRRVVEEITYLNGNEEERIVLSDEVVTNPQNKVILVGTAIDSKTAKEQEAAHNSGFAFPLPSGSWKLGDGYGAGRNHKGVDLLANYGTAIYAVKSGTVIRSTWYSGYGNCVDIDHGNGLVTRYGHASSLVCKVGDKVEAGDIIALVGSTGNSRGNHVHFEVILNGKNLNPLPYINLD